MARIPFTQDAWIKDKSQKIETRNGLPVEIVHCDGYGESPILVTVDLGDGQGVQTRLFFPDGKLYKESSDADLFIVTPKPELSEFEQEVRVCVTENLTTHIKDGNGSEMSSTVFIDDDTAKKMAAELLELARKELIEEQITSDPRKTDLYKLGKAEAMKAFNGSMEKLYKSMYYALHGSFKEE